MTTSMAATLKHILLNKVAVLPGTCDRNGNFIIFLWPTTQQHDLSCKVVDSISTENLEDVHSLLVYFIKVTKYTHVNLECCKFTLIIDARSRKTDNVKQVLKIFEEKFNQYIVCVFILTKSDGFWQNRKFNGSKYTFQLLHGSLEHLSKFVDSDKIIVEFNGSLNFDVVRWVDYRIKTEAFLASTAQFLSETNALINNWISVTPVEPLLPDSIQLKSAVETSLVLVASGAPLPPIRLAIDELDRVKQLIADHDKSRNAGTRLRTILQPLLKEAHSIINQYADEQRFSFLKQTDIDRLTSAMQALNLNVCRCDQAWVRKANELDNILKIRCFERDARRLLDWIEDNEQIILMQFEEIGRSMVASKDLLNAHEQFSSTCLLGSDSSHSIESLKVFEKIISRKNRVENGTELTVNEHVLRRIHVQLNALENSWQTFKSILECRGRLLSAAVNFHSKMEEYFQNVPDWESQCRKSVNKRLGVIELNEISECHQSLTEKIARCYAEVCYWAKIILDTLKFDRTTIDNCRLESARVTSAYVCSMVNETFEQHRNLERLWLEKNVLLQDFTKKAVYRADVAQVSLYLSEQSDAFLARNKSIGRSLTRARALLCAHDQFETMIKTTLIHTRQLIDAICGSLSPSSSRVFADEHMSFCQNSSDELTNRRSEEQRVALNLNTQLKRFTSSLAARRNLLKKSITYYTHHKEVSAWLKELENQLSRCKSPSLLSTKCATNIDDDGMCAQNVNDLDKRIQQLSIEREKSLDSCDKLISEGYELCKCLTHHCNGKLSGDVEVNVKHIEAMTEAVKARRLKLEKKYNSIRSYHEFILNLSMFEQDAIEAEDQLQKIMRSSVDEKKGSSESVNCENDRKTPTCFNAFSSNERACAIVQTTSQRGRELMQLLESSDETEPYYHLSPDERQIALQRVSHHLKCIDEGANVLAQFAEDQRRKLVCRAEFFRFQQICLKVIEWMSDASFRLQSSFALALSFDQATACKQSHDKILTMVEEISVVMNTLSRRHSAIGKYQTTNAIGLLDEAESLLKQTTAQWQRLIAQVDERHRLINAQINFFSNIEKVEEQLQTMINHYSNHALNVVEIVRANHTNTQSMLNSKISKIEEDKQSLMRSCNNVRRIAEALLRYSQRNMSSNDPTVHSALFTLKSALTDRLYKLHTGENHILLIWSRYRNTMNQAIQYITFYSSAQQILSWIERSHLEHLRQISAQNVTLLQTINQTTSNDRSRLIQQHEDYSKKSLLVKEKKGCFQELMNTAVSLFDDEHRFAEDVRKMQNQIEIAFANFISDLEKEKMKFEQIIGCVQHESIKTGTHRLLTTSNNPCALNKRDGRGGRSKRYDFIFAELLKTERSYVKDLSDCIDIYLNAYRSSEDALSADLRNKEYAIFGNIEEVHKFHSRIFLKELHRYETMSEDIGHCFVTTWVDNFKIYVTYCTNKDINSHILNNKPLANFFDSIHVSNETYEPISSYLIKPVQRITKYQLLLKDLTTTSTSHNEELQEALDLMLQVPKKANDAIHWNYVEGVNEEGFRKEHLGQVIMQDSFLVWDSKLRFKKARQRRLFLFDVVLIIAKEMKDSKSQSRYVYKSKVLTAEMSVSEQYDSDELKFALCIGRGSAEGEHRLMLKANSTQTKAEWINQIREINQNKFIYGNKSRERLVTSSSSSSSSASPSSSQLAKEQGNVIWPGGSRGRRRRTERAATISTCSWASTDSGTLNASAHAFPKENKTAPRSSSLVSRAIGFFTSSSKKQVDLQDKSYVSQNHKINKCRRRTRSSHSSKMNKALSFYSAVAMSNTKFVNKLDHLLQ